MLVGLGIPNVGKKTGKQISKVIIENSPPYRGSERGYFENTPPNLPYKGRNQILDSLFSITEENLLEVKDI